MGKNEVMNMKKRTAGIIFSLIFCLFLAACSPDPKTFVDYSTDRSFPSSFMRGLNGIDSCKCEKEYQSFEFFGKKYSLSPGNEATYRVVLSLNEETVNELNGKYSWTLNELYLPEFSQTDISDHENDTWYTSDEFKDDFCEAAGYYYIWYNKKDTMIVNLNKY